MSFTPTRLLVDAHGYARRPQKGDKWDVVFVRNDGWSLAAPAHLRDAARSLWDREWVRVIDCPGTVLNEQVRGAHAGTVEGRMPDHDSCL